MYTLHGNKHVAWRVRAPNRAGSRTPTCFCAYPLLKVLQDYRRRRRRERRKTLRVFDTTSSPACYALSPPNMPHFFTLTYRIRSPINTSHSLHTQHVTHPANMTLACAVRVSVWRAFMGALICTCRVHIVHSQRVREGSTRMFVCARSHLSRYACKGVLLQNMIISKQYSMHACTSKSFGSTRRMYPSR